MVNSNEEQPTLITVGSMNGNRDVAEGVIIISKGTRYSGELKSRNPNGYGTLTLPNGTIYEGNWEDGTLSGKVALHFSNGDAYVGQIKNGKPDGDGTFTWASGKSYRGKWTRGTYKENGVFKSLCNEEESTP